FILVRPNSPNRRTSFGSVREYIAARVLFSAPFMDQSSSNVEIMFDFAGAIRGNLRAGSKSGSLADPLRPQPVHPAAWSIPPPMANVSRRIVICALLMFPLAARPDSDSGANPFELSLDTSVGVPRGWVQVRENEQPGTHLSLHKDLGIDTME